MVSRNTTLVPSLRLRIGPACGAGLSAGMRRERVSPQIRKKERKQLSCLLVVFTVLIQLYHWLLYDNKLTYTVTIHISKPLFHTAAH